MQGQEAILQTTWAWILDSLRVLARGDVDTVLDLTALDVAFSNLQLAQRVRRPNAPVAEMSLAVLTEVTVTIITSEAYLLLTARATGVIVCFATPTKAICTTVAVAHVETVLAEHFIAILALVLFDLATDSFITTVFTLLSGN